MWTELFAYSLEEWLRYKVQAKLVLKHINMRKSSPKKTNQKPNIRNIKMPLHFQLQNQTFYQLT